MGLNKKYTWAWLIWILLFGVIEYKALKDPRGGDTLTEHVRKLIGTTGGREWFQWLFRIGLAGFFAWAIPHFFSGAW